MLNEAEQELVVAHELEHARSGDPLLALAGVCAVVAMPWNVALWWQLSRLRLAIELDCDARVIARQHHDALVYTRLLLSVGERVRGARHPVLAMSRSRSALAKRFDALLRRDVIGRDAPSVSSCSRWVCGKRRLRAAAKRFRDRESRSAAPRAESVVVATVARAPAPPANLVNTTSRLFAATNRPTHTSPTSTRRRRVAAPNIDVNASRR